MDLTEQNKKILKALLDEIKSNPSTSITGVDETLLGNKVGAYLGIGVMYDVDKLRRMGLVAKKGNNVILTQDGIKAISSQDKQKYYFIVGFLLVVGIIVSIVTNNLLYFILGIITSIIAGFIVYLFTKQ